MGDLRPPAFGSSTGSSAGDRNRDVALNVLREAAGRPVSMVELRERGIVNPAAVIYELELAGLPIDRVKRHGRLVGVRLVERRDDTTTPRTPRRFRY